MKDSIDNNNDKPQFISAVSPGSQLRQAREAAGLTRSEIALQMRLSERKIQALEEDNYSLFPSETFVSGYLRSYAKVLGLSEGEFVRPVSSTQLPPVLVSNAAKNKQASSMDLPVRMVSYGIAALVIVSLAVWWGSQREKMTVKPTSEQAAMVQEQPVAQAQPEAVEPQSSAASEEGSTVVDAATDANAVNVAPTPEASIETVANEPVQQEAPRPVQLDPAAPPMVIAAVGSGTQAAPMTEENAAPEAPPLTDDIPRSNLIFEYQNDSWTEVDDAAGRRLIYGLMRAGQTVEIKGEAPFKVFLGYAEGVTIHYNNELFDHTAYHRGEIARFRIGRTEHNQLGSR